MFSAHLCRTKYWTVLYSLPVPMCHYECSDADSPDISWVLEQGYKKKKKTQNRAGWQAVHSEYMLRSYWSHLSSKASQKYLNLPEKQGHKSFQCVCALKCVWVSSFPACSSPAWSGLFGHLRIKYQVLWCKAKLAQNRGISSHHTELSRPELDLIYLSLVSRGRAGLDWEQ